MPDPEPVGPLPPTQPTSAVKDMEGESASTRLLLRIIAWSTAIAFGAAVASAQALQLTPGGFSFKLSIGTGIAFALGIVITLVFWRVVASGRSGVWKGSLLLLVMGAGLFLYPLRFIPARILPEVGVGLIAAICALSILGFLFWRVTRFFESDEQAEEK